ncbi:UNC-like C-terminal-domain-containing protein [Sphaerosporella brunnea]|uniref:SUN-like protein 1 n=1 Tax=Sphaerosporella brunnea TaxID=1250544 RepID=A0A5J5EF17_9PEZI|nr:UNC-like C-terminal-domain-containing protein [Sphaerosporella brunnea]
MHLARSKWPFVIAQLLLLLATASQVATTTTAPSSDSSVIAAVTSTATVTRHPLASGAVAVLNSTPTCQSVSVNYVSPGLPAQCLRTRSTSQETFAQNDSRSTATETAATAIAGESDKTRELATITTTIPSPESTPSSSVTAASSTSSPSTQLPEAIPKTPEEPPAKFLSFEEWKAQNLAKVGQNSDSFSERGVREPRRAPGAGNTVLDALGDEIEISFEFGSSGSPANTIQVSGTAAEGPRPTDMPRSKDAGKTCKERFNYASFDCAATVHKVNKEGKGANSILLENKETYMLNKCGAKDKFFIVELCDDILVDTVVLANFEFFSSVFKEIRVSVSDRYPVKANGWKELGTFMAKNTRDVQAFLVENPLIWARYMKVDILSHYGNEFYCPISLLRVHGTTMMEEFRSEAAAARGGDEDVTEDVVPEAVAEPVKSAQAAEEHEPEKTATESNPEKTADIPVDNVEKFASEIVEEVVSTSTASLPVSTSHPIEQSLNTRYRFPIGQPSCPKIEPKPTRTSVAQTTTPQIVKSVGTVPSETTFTGTPPPVESSTVASQASTPSSNASEPPELRTRSQSTKAVEPRIPESQPKPASPQPPAASPTTQESFFKSVHKRLTHLEANSTLSLQYIEEQSRLMRDTFAKMERSHVSKMEELLQVINASAFTDLKTYRDKYDQLWQSTVLALESNRMHSEREMLAISTRLSLLADEVIFQKRMYQLNTILLLVTIGVVLFSRNDRLALPLTRHLRTHSSMRLFESPPTSPPLGNPIPTLNRGRSNSSDSQHSVLGSPISPPASREGSPVIGGSTTPQKQYRAERRSWINFGPRFRVESRGRRWQRMPSPLAGAENGEPGDAVYTVDGAASNYFAAVTPPPDAKDDTDAVTYENGNGTPTRNGKGSA